MTDEYSLWLSIDEHDARTGAAQDLGEPVPYRITADANVATMLLLALVESEKSRAMLAEFSHGYLSSDEGYGTPLSAHREMPYRLWAFVLRPSADGSWTLMDDSLVLVAGYDSRQEADAALVRITADEENL